MKLNKSIRLLLLGAPGSGKGTQTSRLLKAFLGIKSLSSGDTLRAEIARGSNLGDEVYPQRVVGAGFHHGEPNQRAIKREQLAQ